MRLRNTVVVGLVAALAGMGVASAADFGTGFTYQGKISYDGDPPIDGIVGLRFRLFNYSGDPNVPSTQIGADSLTTAVLEDGYFSATVNAGGEFGPNAFDGGRRLLGIYVTFDPNQPGQTVNFSTEIFGVPYAQFGANGGGAGGGAWQTSGSDIYYDQGRVGVGTTNLTNEELAVSQRIRVFNNDESRSLQTWVGTSGAVIDAENAHLQLRTDGVDRIFVNQAGNVGIGATSPGAPLQVGTGDTRMYVGRDPSLELRKEVGVEKFRIQCVGNNYGDYILQLGRDDGNHDIAMTGSVGLGTEDPFGEMHIHEKDLNANTLSPGLSTNTDLLIESEIANITLLGDPAGNSDAFIDLASTDQSGTSATRVDSVWRLLKRSENASSGSGDLQLSHRAFNPGGNNLVNDVEHTFADNGRVGFGTFGPLASLHSQGNDIGIPANSISSEDLLIEDSDAILGLFSDEGGSWGSAINLKEIDAGGLVDVWGIARRTSAGGSELRFTYGTAASQASNPLKMALTTDGTIELFNNVVPSARTMELHGDWQGTGKSRIVVDVVQINGADLSEQFDITGDLPIQPGLVVSIDPTNPGKLQVATDSYDKKVAGIVSGAGGVNTGLVMGQEGTLASGEHPVALTGRVWCYVDASFGAIEPGDLLTTSKTPGHAMLASDDSRSRGAVIGKAMTGLESGKGMVLVLVQPQ